MPDQPAGHASPVLQGYRPFGLVARLIFTKLWAGAKTFVRKGLQSLDKKSLEELAAVKVAMKDQESRLMIKLACPGWALFVDSNFINPIHSK
jgi:hypothetical protein